MIAQFVIPSEREGPHSWSHASEHSRDSAVRAGRALSARLGM